MSNYIPVDRMHCTQVGGREDNRPFPLRCARYWFWLPTAVLVGACSLFPAGPAGNPGGGSPTAAMEETAAETPPNLTPTETLTPTPTGTPVVLNPLTGLPVEDAALIQRRPIAVKVSNYPRTARPQAGLSYADLLFEFYQEYGMTRFHALYLTRDVEKVGPIRSGRMIDTRLQNSYQSYLVFNAADVRVWEWFELQEIKEWILYEGPVECPALCRDPLQAQINSLYGNTAELREAAHNLKREDIVPDLNGMVFSAEPPEMSGTASTVRVRFLTDFAIAEWRYNPEDERYYRSSETDKENGEVEPLLDRLTGEQLSVSNLIVVYVNFVRRQRPEMYELELFGNGKALFFRNGMWETGVWRLPNKYRPLQFYGPEGPFYLHPGVSWIALVEDSSTEISEGDTLRIEFGQPDYGGG